MSPKRSVMLLVLASGLLRNGRAQAATTEGFEDYASGTALNNKNGGTNWSTAWTGADSTGEFKRIEDNTVTGVTPSEGTKQLHIYGTGGIPDGSRKWTPYTDDVLHYRFDFRILNGALAGTLQIMLGDDSGATQADRKVLLRLQDSTYTTSPKAITSVCAGGTETLLVRWDGSDGIANAVANYVTLELYVNRITLTYDVWYGGVLVGSDLGWRQTGLNNTLNQIRFLGGNSGSAIATFGGVYIDNIIIEGLPSAPAGTPVDRKQVVISQIYGGGGEVAGSPYNKDFVELFNKGATTVNLTGWSVQYAGQADTTWTVGNRVILTGSIAPGHYYLIQEGSGAGTNGNPLPTSNVTGTANLDAANGKVALVNTTVLLGGSGCPFSCNVVDFMGYGAANCAEPDSTKPAAAPSNTTAAFRTTSCNDTDNNLNDFTTAAPNPRNSSNTNSCSAGCLDPFADADGDGDVDASDFAVWQTCFTGSTATISSLGLPLSCLCFDRDHDWHVFDVDLETFNACVSGSSVPANPACDDQ